MPIHKGGMKGRKYGRNERKCKRYRDSGRQEINKRRKLRKHVASHPNDKEASAVLVELGG